MRLTNVATGTVGAGTGDDSSTVVVKEKRITEKIDDKNGYQRSN